MTMENKGFFNQAETDGRDLETLLTQLFPLQK
jgi:hypothetical protein